MCRSSESDSPSPAHDSSNRNALRQHRQQQPIQPIRAAHLHHRPGLLRLSPGHHGDRRLGFCQETQIPPSPPGEARSVEQPARGVLLRRERAAVAVQAAPERDGRLERTSLLACGWFSQRGRAGGEAVRRVIQCRVLRWRVLAEAGGQGNWGVPPVPSKSQRLL